MAEFCPSTMQPFFGVNQDVSEFLKQFEQFCLLKKIAGEERKLVFPSFLKGAALAFFRTIESTASSFEDVKKEFEDEFESPVNYQELFYHAKQDDAEDILEYYYRMLELASKAKIAEDSVFINQFLKTVKPFFMHKLASTLLSTKRELKRVVQQLKMIYDEGTRRPTNLPMMTAPQASNSRAAGDSPGRWTRQSPMNEYRTPPASTTPPQRLAEQGRGAAQRFTPQTHRPGAFTRQNEVPPSHRYDLRSSAARGMDQQENSRRPR